MNCLLCCLSFVPAASILVSILVSLAASIVASLVASMVVSTLSASHRLYCRSPRLLCRLSLVPTVSCIDRLLYRARCWMLSYVAGCDVLPGAFLVPSWSSDREKKLPPVITVFSAPNYCDRYGNRQGQQNAITTVLLNSYY